jgi:hypothetical protein
MGTRHPSVVHEFGRFGGAPLDAPENIGVFSGPLAEIQRGQL